MSDAIDNLQAAQQRAMAGRPKVGGFPYLAATLRRAGVTRNLWFLPACESLYLTERGAVVTHGAPMVSGMVDVPNFDRDALVAALRTDQAGQSTLPEFLAACWRAGVVLIILISAKKQRRNFRRFYRVDQQATDHSGGSGLGLAIVEFIARSHGGTVTVESTLGVGSTFTLSIRCDKSDGAAA
jgi:uncharacterized protein YbcV (DUF1398 family)